MAAIVPKGDPNAVERVRTTFTVALRCSDERAITDVVDTIVAEGMAIELKIRSTHPMARTAERLFSERKIGQSLVFV